MPSVTSVSVYIMDCMPGRDEERGGPKVQRIRPAHDSAPDHLLLMTHSEFATLRRRVASYVETCRGRRLAERGKG